MKLIEPRKDKIVPVTTVSTWGWFFDGTEIPENIILTFAKHGFLISYTSTEENEGDGAYCTVMSRYKPERNYVAGKWIVFVDRGWSWLLIDDALEWEPAPVDDIEELVDMGEMIG